MAADLLELTLATDVRETPAAVLVPTLVVHRRGDRAIRLRAAEQLAALIPTAELVVLEGDGQLPWYGDTFEVLAAIAPFLAVTAPPRESPVEVDELSPREREVLRLLADGLSEPTRRAPVSSDPA
jgi:hypothetical protein